MVLALDNAHKDTGLSVNQYRKIHVLFPVFTAKNLKFPAGL